MDFCDKVVVVTGASSGIGAATAKYFARESANVVLIGRNENALNEIAAECEKAKGIKPLIIKAELSNDDEVKNIVTKTIEVFGRIDVLVNNAGYGGKAGILDGIEPYDHIMKTNVRAVYLLTSLCTPHLVKTKGNIVNVSSVAAFRPIKDLHFLPYCISKAALDQFTRCLAVELAKYGIRVNSVNPGATRTNFVLAAGLSKEKAEELYKVRDKVMPLGKVAESEDIADMIVFLASNRARSITGAIHVIDNGENLV
ncbi:unnamed protein product [Diatraea saccharalis]|uniref:Uncharacterized protein n=1 Tax=Diatraea saccharalis TaxID=40085 RepID=A0A9N9R2F9_9NEOP|nr:unnamed protein product [Diatraea saccharalis]